MTGLALVLLLGASGEGCGGSGGGDSDCPKLVAAGPVAVAAGAVVRLPAGDLDDDIERAKEIAQRIADARDGTCEQSAKGLGYKVTIPLTKRLHIEVRVMARSEDRKNYYRINVPGKDAYDKDGNKSNDRGKTHIDIDDTVDNILDIIDTIKDCYT